MNKACTLIFVWLCVSQSSLAQACQVNVIMFGDSITQGLMRDTNYDESGVVNFGNGREVDDFIVNPPISYGTRLKQLIKGTGCRDVNVYNWGFRGYETNLFPALVMQTVSHLNARKSPNSLNYAFIMMGANDAYDGEPSSEVTANITQVVNSYKSSGISPVISTITSNKNFNFNAVINKYNLSIKSYANRRNVALVDNNNTLLPWTSYHSGDSLHVNEAGYTVMGGVWFSAIEQKINDTYPNIGNGFMPAVMLLLSEPDEEVIEEE